MSKALEKLRWRDSSQSRAHGHHTDEAPLKSLQRNDPRASADATNSRAAPRELHLMEQLSRNHKKRVFKDYNPKNLKHNKTHNATKKRQM